MGSTIEDEEAHLVESLEDDDEAFDDGETDEDVDEEVYLPEFDLPTSSPAKVSPPTNIPLVKEPLPSNNSSTGSSSMLVEGLTTSTMPKSTTYVPATLNPLLEDDLTDLMHKISPKFVGGASHQVCSDDKQYILITFHFFTDYIDPETASQWLVCHKNPLTVVLKVHQSYYLDEKIIIENIYQTCACHPSNSTNVPFIKRLLNEFLEENKVTNELLERYRCHGNPKQRQKCFLKLISNKGKRAQLEEMLSSAHTDSELDELLDMIIENECLDGGERLSSLLSPLRKTRSEKQLNHYDVRDPKQMPTLRDGFFVRFCLYTEYRLRNLNSLCVMCGKRTFDSTDLKMIARPTICSDYSCFCNAMDSKFRNDPLPPSIFSIEIADFLFLLARGAIMSERHDIILDPYPRLVNPYNTSLMLMDETGNKAANIEILRKIVTDLVEMKSITSYEMVKRISLRSSIELKNPWGFSFFHWLMCSNRYHFNLIPENLQMTQPGTRHQFFIKHEDPQKHKNFKRLREKHGTVFAFHGSPQENWHSILRNGLRAGKDKTLLHGAAYGTGIYISPQFSMSAGYSSRFTHHYNYSNQQQPYDPTQAYVEPPPLSSTNWCCIALCEIINSDNAYNNHNSSIWTLQDPNLICTRFIFFYPTGISRSEWVVTNAGEGDKLRDLIRTLNACSF